MQHTGRLHHASNMLTKAQKRAQAAYAAKRERLKLYSRRKFPTPAKATKADRSAATRLARAIFGTATKPPLVTDHTSIVHLVTSTKQEETLQKLADAEMKPRLAEWKKKTKSWKEWAKRQRAFGIEVNTKPPQKPTRTHTFQRASKAEAKTIKRDIGQKTPGDIDALFLRQDPVDGTFTGASVVKLPGLGWVTLNGWQYVIFRPINPRNYVADQDAEVKRVIAQLHEDFDLVAAQVKQQRGLKLDRNNISFAPQVGNHKHYGSYSQPGHVVSLMQEWAGRYGVERSTGPGSSQGQAPVMDWLRGFNMLIFVGAAGKAQWVQAWTAQARRKIHRKKMAQVLARKRRPPKQ
jgi:hypothetical protein